MYNHKKKREHLPIDYNCNNAEVSLSVEHCPDTLAILVQDIMPALVTVLKAVAGNLHR